MWKIKYTKQAEKDKKKLRAAGLSDKAKFLIEVVRKNPFAEPPEFESLKGNLNGAYSRRINLQHRFVYQVIDDPIEEEDVVFEGAVKILSMWTHYENLNKRSLSQVVQA